MALSDSFLQDLRFKCDIEDTISQYVNLKRKGNTSVGLCPFHNEKTPSFTVYNDTQSFYCFGCGAGGDVITFVRKIDNLDYIDAVKQLAERAGIEMPDNGYDNSLSKLRRRVLEANRVAAKFYFKYLLSPEGKIGLDYFVGRGLSMETIKHFGLGFAPNAWDSLIKHMKPLGFTDDELVSANLARRSAKGRIYDNFRNRVMTPIINISGNVIAFGGRVLDDSKPKYINTSDTLAYKKTHELFGLNFAKNFKGDSLILCEGYMDVIAMHQAGFENAVACCGTSLTSEQVKIISRYCKKVSLCYDADEAGQKAAEKAISLFSVTDLDVRVMQLGGGKDPDEIIKNLGAERFKGMIEKAENDTDFRLQKIKKKFDITSNSGKINYFREAIKILATLAPIECDIYMSKLSEELNVNKESIKVQLNDFISKNRQRRDQKEMTNIISEKKKFDSKFNPTSLTNLRLAKAQEELVSLLLMNPDFFKFSNGLSPEMIDAPLYRKAFSVISERLSEERPVDLTSIGGEFSPDELGHLAYIQTKSKSLNNAKQEFTDCINTILDENNKLNVSPPEILSDDEFRNLFGNK